MSYNNDDNYESPYNQSRSNRAKVNVNFFASDFYKNEKEKRWCKPCRKSLLPKDDKLFCTICGHYYPIVVEQQAQPQQNKITSKFQHEQNNHTIIQSKDFNNNRRKRRQATGSVNDFLTDEDREDLARSGLYAS
jgi:hypothetical protein